MSPAHPIPSPLHPSPSPLTFFKSESLVSTCLRNSCHSNPYVFVPAASLRDEVWDDPSGVSPWTLHRPQPATPEEGTIQASVEE